MRFTLLKKTMSGETISILVMLGSGVYTVGASTFRFLRDKRAMNWPTVTGEVITSHAKGKWDSSSGSDGGTEISYMYSPEVIYSYTIDGRTYEGYRTHQFEVSSSSRSWAEKSASKLPVGSEVEVLYYPRRPSISMLRRAALKLPWFLLGFTFGTCLIIGSVIWHLKRDSTAANNASIVSLITLRVD